MIMSELSNNLLDEDFAETPGAFFEALRQNSEFRVLFGDRVHRHLFNQGALRPEAMVTRWQELSLLVVPGILGESARWGDHWRDVRKEPGASLYTYDTPWKAEISRIEKDYLPFRGEQVLEDLRARGLYPSLAAPQLSPVGRSVQAGETATLSGGTVYYTLDGTDPRAVGGAIAAGAQVYATPITVSQNLTVKARTYSKGAWSALVEADFEVP